MYASDQFGSIGKLFSPFRLGPSPQLDGRASSTSSHASPIASSMPTSEDLKAQMQTCYPGVGGQRG